MEEYQSLLESPKPLYKNYTYYSSEQAPQRLEVQLCLKVTTFKPHMAGETRGWLWLPWKSKFDKKLSNKDANKGWLRIIALGIFGLVLVVAYTNLIDYEAGSSQDLKC